MKRLTYRQEQIILNNDYLLWLLESLENIFFYRDSKKLMSSHADNI
jgi:hypothetical protein